MKTLPEPNPYESPKTDQPLMSAQVVRRGISVVTIVILAPLVAMVAWFAAFWVMIYVLVALGEGPGWHDGLIALVAYVMSAVALAGMIAWAVRTHRRDTARDTKEGSKDDLA